MTDILDRLPTEALLALLQMLAYHRQLYREAMLEWNRGGPGNPALLLTHHGREFMRAAFVYMETVVLNKQTYCARHACNCDVFPPAEVRAEFGCLICVAGWTCVPWSSMSRSFFKRWLHDCSLVFIAWIWSTLAEAPEMIVGECVKGFDWAFLKELLDLRGYDLHPIFMNPKDFGYPSDRQRVYMIITRRRGVRIHDELNQDLFQRMFYKRCVTDARIFFRAPASEVRMHINSLAEASSLPTGEAITWPLELVLPRSQLKRLEGFERLGQTQSRRFFICDVNQNPSFWKRVTARVPALLRNSCLVAVLARTSEESGIEWERKPMLMCEEFGVQAIPTLLPSTHYLTSLLPRKLRFSALRSATRKESSIREREYRSMAGNGQHAANIGAALLIVISCCEILRDGADD